MRLIKGVAGKGFNQVKYLDCQLTLKPLALGAVNKPLPLLGHQRGDFLAHRLAYRVRLAQGIAGKVLQNQQHLVLVNNDSVGLVQQILEAGVGVGNRGAPVLGVNEGVNMLHRPRPVQGNHRGDVPQVGGLQLLDVPLHTSTFQLEQVGGLAGREQLKGLFIIEGQASQVDFDAPGFIQQLGSPVEDSQVGQTQKVHFQQAQLGYRVHGILGHQHRAVLVAPGGTLQGHRLGQGFVGNQHPGSVGADVMHDTLQPLGVIHQFANCPVRRIGIAELRVDAQGILQSAGFEGDHTGNPVHIAVAHAETPAYVPQGGLGSHRAEGYYLGHPVVAVAVDDVVQHLIPPVVLEVHVNVRHLFAFQVEKPLKDQAILQGVHVGNPQAVEGHAGGGAAPDAEHYPVAVHEVHDVPHHQEIVGELGIANYLQLILEPLLRLRGGTRVAFLEALPAQLGQILIGVHIVGRRVLGQVSLAEAQFDLAHIGNQLGVVQSLGVIGK